MLLGIGSPDNFLAVNDNIEEIPPVLSGAASTIDLSHSRVHVWHQRYSFTKKDKSFCIFLVFGENNDTYQSFYDDLVNKIELY